MFIDKQLGQDRKWINIDSDLIAENSYLYKKYDIDKETIEYAMDKNERAHMDYNREKRNDHLYLQCIGFRKGQGILRNHPHDLYRSRYATRDHQ